MTALDREELVDYPVVEARLLAKFSPPLDPDEVRRCLRDCSAQFEDARVRTYLPVLVERAASARLRAVIDGSNGIVNGRTP